MQQINYEQIIKNFENYRLPKKCSARKKFKKRFGAQIEASNNEIIRIKRSYTYSVKIARKYKNHLKAQNKTKHYSRNPKVLEKFRNMRYYEHKKSKGMFNCCIRIGNAMVSINRTKIELITPSGKLNLNDKSERFSAIIEYDLNLDFFEKIQQILKQKPSGDYLVYIGA